MTKELINKYFTGTCSEEEQERVMEYIKGDDLQLLHDYMDEVANSTSDENTINKEESDKLLHAIHGTINTEDIIRQIHDQVTHENAAFELTEINNLDGDIYQETEQNSKKRRVYRSLPMKIAASIALICTLGGSYFIWQGYNSDKSSNTMLIQLTTVENPSQNVKQVKMPDGTMIWLNAHSSFTYNSSAYNITKREIRIYGEAYFDVTHNQQKPFIVRSGNISTTVMGTAFNVEAYKNEKDVRVILVRGKVSVQAPGQQQVLTPGQMLSYSTAGNTLAVRNIETREVSSWINGKTVFNDLPLEVAFTRIENLYGINIQIISKSKLRDKRLTGVFESKTPEDILNKILFVYGLNYTKKGGVYIIK